MQSRLGARFLLTVLAIFFATVFGQTTPAPGADDAKGNGSSGSAGEAGKRIKVLFLGDDGHHRPLERCRQVFVDMAHRGIDFTYTERMEDLNPQTLARYDTLLV